MLCILPGSAQDKEPRVQYSSVPSLQSSSRSKLHDSNSSVFACGQQTRHNRFFCVRLAGGVASSDVVACVRWRANTAKTPIRLIADPPAFQRKTHISKSRPMARAVAETQRHLNRQGSLDFCRSCTLRDVHGESSGLWCFCFEGTQAGSFERLVQGVQGPVDKEEKKNPDDPTPSIPPPPAAVRHVRFRSQRPSDLTGTVLRVCGCPHPNTRQTVSLPLASYLIYFTVG